MEEVLHLSPSPYLYHAEIDHLLFDQVTKDYMAQQHLEYVEHFVQPIMRYPSQQDQLSQ